MSKEDPGKMSPPSKFKVPTLNRASAMPINASQPSGRPLTERPLEAAKPIDPVASNAPRNPLRRHSLRGDAAKLQAEATETRPLLGEFVMLGQATMIYAQPNAGKTLTVLKLIVDAIEAHHE